MGEPARVVVAAGTEGGTVAEAPDLSRLYFAIEGARKGDEPLIVQFAGVAGGEGVSTIADAFARRCALETDKPVLILRCGAAGGAEGLSGLLDLTASSVGDARAADAPDRAGGLGRRYDGSVRVASLGMTAQDVSPRKLRALAEALRASFGLVVMDCQPLRTSPLAGALAGIADGTIVVAAAGRTRRTQLARTIADFGRMGGQVIGLVLNRQHDWLPPWLRRRLG